jgi:mRNA-degrading endonuclease toxin of MazEF toxin-antitoxin module
MERVSIKRGDIVRVALYQDKVRQCVVVHSYRFAKRYMFTVCPITSTIVAESKLLRVTVESGGSGLAHRSQVMADQVMSLRYKRLREVVGRLTTKEMTMVDQALKLWLDLK